MVWFGYVLISLLVIWIAFIRIESDKNNKETEYLSEQNAKERQKEVKYTEEKHKKIKIK